jgi:trans-aconitate 2-methyltransferase
MADWNPALYRRFEDERTRPARELLARVPLEKPRVVFDLGCGPGNSTELLVQRFPDAHVVGIDNSPAMIESARKRLPGTEFELADVSTWQPAEAPDLIYTNATLQWVPDHRVLFPRLFSLLAPGGVLAVQMPDNMQEPSHLAMHEVAAQDPWRDAIGDAAKVRQAILPIGSYYDLLVKDASLVDVWHTIYQHPMASPAAIVEWLSSTGLRPFVDKLPEGLRASFVAQYERCVARDYAVRADGKLLLAFPRLFVVAQKKA